MPRRQSSSQPEFTGKDDLLELLESLPRTRVDQETYTEKDRAADFLAVFSSDRGRRVLDQIVQICDPAARLEDADKHGTLAFKAGQRRVLAEIQRCFVVREPITVEKAPVA